MNICMRYRRTDGQTDGRTDIQQNENGCQDYLPRFLLGNNYDGGLQPTQLYNYSDAGGWSTVYPTLWELGGFQTQGFLLPFLLQHVVDPSALLIQTFVISNSDPPSSPCPGTSSTWYIPSPPLQEGWGWSPCSRHQRN